MGCGCKKAKNVQPRLPGSAQAATMSLEPKTYDVFDAKGDLVASSTNIVFARVEARRTGGTVVPRQSTPVSQA